MSILIINIVKILIFLTLTDSTAIGSIIHPVFNIRSQASLNDRQEIEENVNLYFINRSGWKALPTTHQSSEELEVIPVQYVVIYHTGTESCFNRSTCDDIVRGLQKKYMAKYPSDRDIGYNFLISGNGYVYVGRGWNFAGDHTLGMNTNSLGIALIGTFYEGSPSRKQFEALIYLITCGVKCKKIEKPFSFYSYPEFHLIFDDGNKILNITQVIGS